MAVNTLRLSTAIKTARAEAIKAALDSGSTGAKILCYTTPIPTNGGDAITTQTLLGTLTCSKPSGTVSNGVFTFDAITSDSSADANGTIAFCRVLDGSGTFCFDGDASTTGNGGVFQFNTLTTSITVAISMTSGTITEQ